MDVQALTCGQELAASAAIPEALAALLKHVATNLEAHARWVGNDTQAALTEQAAMAVVACKYRELAEATEELVSTMRSCAQLPAAEHDPAQQDRANLRTWLEQKVTLQRELAHKLEQGAKDAEAALRDM
jgi:hypothetical protein